jgi:hypothetical protein
VAYDEGAVVSDDQTVDSGSGADEQEPTGKGLRAQLEKALAEKAELAQKYEEAARKARQSELQTFLAGRELNPKIAQFIPDGVEGEEGISKWLDENGELFGVAPSKPQEQKPEVDPSVVAAAQKLQGFNQASSAPSGFGDITARIKGANSREELAALVDEARRQTLA